MPFDRQSDRTLASPSCTGFRTTLSCQHRIDLRLAKRAARVSNQTRTYVWRLRVGICGETRPWQSNSPYALVCVDMSLSRPTAEQERLRKSTPKFDIAKATDPMSEGRKGINDAATALLEQHSQILELRRKSSAT